MNPSNVFVEAEYADAFDKEQTTDLFNLLTAIRVVNTEMSKIVQTYEQRKGTRRVINQLLDQALELTMDETVLKPVGELPY